MTLSPIHKVLSIVKSCNARFLVMGGQACVLYGAAEFTRALDLTVGIDPQNVEAIRRALGELQAEQIDFPGLEPDALERGHACHFRCNLPEAGRLRVDLMTRMRGCPSFPDLWDRRTVVELTEAGSVGVIALPDLVQAKKTQRDKDWPMIRRLVEVDYYRHRDSPAESDVRFWLKECRTPTLLAALARQYAEACQSLVKERSLLANAIENDMTALERNLLEEEFRERQADRLYWAPLRAELEQWRREQHRRNRSNPE